ncbi:hypothetical protein HMI46_14740 [Paenibacillus alvei]|uniref:Uncharacterized protein n=1 Tax=Paenibacillus alvei TaxID=44250 RepID=A0AAP6ZXH8_PAEAL|nr:hypothetical protein [Paenibacillus alvei]
MQKREFAFDCNRHPLRSPAGASAMQKIAQHKTVRYLSEKLPILLAALIEYT